MKPWIKNDRNYVDACLIAPNTDPKEPLKCYCVGCGEITEVKTKNSVELPDISLDANTNKLYFGEYLPLRIYQFARKDDDGKYRTCLCKKCLKDYKENEQWMKNLISSMALVS